MKAIVSATGEVVIPATLRDRLGVQPGDDVEIHDEGGAIVMRNVDSEVTA